MCVCVCVCICIKMLLMYIFERQEKQTYILYINTFTQKNKNHSHSFHKNTYLFSMRTTVSGTFFFFLKKIKANVKFAVQVKEYSLHNCYRKQPQLFGVWPRIHKGIEKVSGRLFPVLKGIKFSRATCFLPAHLFLRSA